MATTINILLIVSFALLLVSLTLTFVRLLKGPDTSNRIAGMDLVASITMAFILVYSVVIDEAIYFDIALIISLISFIGTVAISSYLKHKKS